MTRSGGRRERARFREGFEAALWKAYSNPVRVDGPLSQSIETDTVVIGGGFTGLSAALELRALGRSAVVLEAHEPGWGASGRNTGIWAPFWLAMTPDKLVENYGVDRGGRIARMMIEAARAIPETVQKYDIDCGARTTGVLMCAAKTKSFETLKSLADQWNRAGGNVEVIDRAQVRRLVASDHYIGGINYRDGGMIDPLAFTRGLALAATAEGAEVFTGSPATAIEQDGSGWRVVTPSGEVRAENVILATNVYTAGLWPGLEKTFYKLTLAMLATEPFADRGASFLPGGVPFVDAEMVDSFGAGFDREGRLVMSLPPSVSAALPPEKVLKPFWKKFREVFPHAPETVGVSHVWYGDVCTPPGLFPRVYNPAQGIYAVLGYSGNGITQATGMGREIARFAATGDPDACALPPSEIKAAPARWLVNFALRRIVLPLARQYIFRFG